MVVVVDDVAVVVVVRAGMEETAKNPECKRYYKPN